MLQRIQTIYLILSFVLGLLLFFFPFMSVIGFENTYIIKATGVFIEESGASIQPLWLLLTLSIIVTTLPLLIIFLYKKRIQQMRLSAATMVALLATLAAAFYYQQLAVILTEVPEKAIVSYGVSSILPAIAIIFMFLARKAIKKDEDLIKSVDRLR